MKIIFLPLKVLLLILLFGPFILFSDGFSQTTSEDKIVIGTRVVPPFVIEENGEYTGLTVHLWEHIASELDLNYQFEETSIQHMIDGTADSTYFASASALTITADREELVDFTHPYIVTGLGIAVSYKPAGILQAFKAIFSGEFLWVVTLLIGLLLFWGLLVWIFERHENRDEFGGTTAEGIGSGFWWAAVTMTTVGYGDKSPRTLGGRIIGFIWMFAAIILISFFTASIASSLTVTQLDSRVSGPEDLPNVRVGALQNSATLTFLGVQNINATSFNSIDAGLRAVENGAIDAFVHDAPIVSYYTNRDYKNRVRVLPNTFNDQYYGIALPLNSAYRNEMNRIILNYIKSDEWSDLVDEYLGE
ncbi:MAG TPA: transporter substrate-binding domain-containing protein [Balneolaceae bacterium]|nr:transporter substrate-binding domain-containing protein [Balneolaceae bacterium]